MAQPLPINLLYAMQEDINLSQFSKVSPKQ